MLSLFNYALAFVTLFTCTIAKRPEKVYGVNLGTWLVFEPWMAEQEWKDMGGQMCSDCSTCIRSEWALNNAYPDTADTLFKKHWETWFTQSDVDQLVELGINTVRIPVGFWIVEALVDRQTEFYARGGLVQLKRGLRMLKNAGIQAILDHHALPGVATPGQMFAGNCTNIVEFYTPPNYARALTWTAVMTALAHLEPDFASLFAIEAVNEPIMDATKTPGLQDFYNHFVQVVRIVELALGVFDDGDDILPGFNVLIGAGNFQGAVNSMSQINGIDVEVQVAVQSALEILIDLSVDSGVDLDLNLNVDQLNREPLIVNFMDYLWQYNSPKANGATAAIGAQAYDDHLYYNFGGVADPNEDAYLTDLCNKNRLSSDSKVGNTPLWFGEWSLATQFNATDEFIREWADAQKLIYGQGAGWIFWNFKIETSELEGAFPRQWSYFEGVARGYLTRDPSKYFNKSVCVPYYNANATVSS